MNIKILDCTLRDGGYINEWSFSDSQINSILGALYKANIDIVECGYINDKKGTTANSTLFANTKAVDKVLAKGKKETQNVVMINLGDYDISTLPNKSDTNIDGIRLAFHKIKLEDALVVGEEIVSLGYKLYFQPMITKNYSYIEFLQMIEKVNKLNPYAFYIVDSFGSMTLDEFHKYLVLSDSSLNKTIELGYHSHNNMQLAFSNAVDMCNSNIKRDIIIDASIYGIGRGAGNLNTELIADYLNKSFEKKYETLPLLEIIDQLLSSMMKQTPWGFTPAQFLSASLNCHPNYATYLINKNTNHIVGVKRILEKLPEEKKSSFCKDTIEKLYIDSILEPKSELQGSIDLDTNKKVLLLASGKSVSDYEELIHSKIEDNNYIVIALNHIANFDCDYFLFTNQKRFDEFSKNIDKEKTIITNNISTNQEVNAVADFSKFAFVDGKLTTNVAIVAINLLIQKGFHSVEIAGLDGYKVDFDNYNYNETSKINDLKELAAQNELISFSLKKLSKKIRINLVTPSIFKEL